jgi:predicted alternative tryptophan synthase beta-subunit
MRRTHLSLTTAPRNGPAPPTQHRRKAVETLAEAATNAMRRAAGEKALETIRQRGYLDWHTYVEALQQELAQGLKRYT